jgi:hypothetical protein
MISDLLLAIALQTASASTTPISFSPEGTGWALVANASGTAEISNESLHIQLHDLLISRSPGTTGTIKLTSYRVCLAYQRTEAVWDMAACSKPKKVKLSVEPEGVKSIPDDSLDISIKGLPPLNLFWLVIELEAPLRGRGIGHMYSRTRKDIFKTTSVENHPQGGR